MLGPSWTLFIELHTLPVTNCEPAVTNGEATSNMGCLTLRLQRLLFPMQPVTNWDACSDQRETFGMPDSESDLTFQVTLRIQVLWPQPNPVR